MKREIERRPRSYVAKAVDLQAPKKPQSKAASLARELDAELCALSMRLTVATMSFLRGAFDADLMASKAQEQIRRVRVVAQALGEQIEGTTRRD